MIAHWQASAEAAQRLFQFRCNLQQALDELLVKMLGEGTDNGFKTILRNNGTPVGILLTFDEEVIAGIGGSAEVKSPNKRRAKKINKNDNKDNLNG